MLYWLLFLVVPLLADGDDDGDHSGHAHKDETIADCECSTGIITEDLPTDCSTDTFQADLEVLETYLANNTCIDICTDHTDAGFKCYQVFALLVQYHDYCITGSVDEELFHDYIDVCSDCYQNHLQIDGAPDCDASINCTDTVHQEEDVELLLEDCITECPDSVMHEGETESCEEVWQHVEGYHRMCAHEQLSVKFEQLYDQASFSETVCEDIHCNVPWEYDSTADCSAEKNEHATEHRMEYGALLGVVDGVVAFGEPEESAGNQLIAGVIAFVSILSVMFT